VVEAVEVYSLFGKVVDGEGGATEAAATGVAAESLDDVCTATVVVSVAHPPSVSGCGGVPVFPAVGIRTEVGIIQHEPPWSIGMSRLWRLTVLSSKTRLVGLVLQVREAYPHAGGQ